MEKYYKELHESVINILKNDGYAIKFIANPTEELQIEAVKRNGYLIKYIDNPSEEVQLIAVKNNGYAIQFIENPSEEVQLEAVKKILLNGGLNMERIQKLTEIFKELEENKGENHE